MKMNRERIGRFSLFLIPLLLLGLFRAAGAWDVELPEDREPALRTGGTFLLTDVRILPADGPAIEGDLWVRNGKIAALGRFERPDEDLLVIEGNGGTVIPGIVDCHSHIAIDGGVNEWTLSITGEVRIRDVVDPSDVSIFRAAAGGVTTAHLLHGSANTIGGQNAVIKLKVGKRAEDLLLADAPRGIKFALGENVKQSNWGKKGTRFPNTRMGVEALLRRAFTEAREYARKKAAWKRAKEQGADPRPFRRDERLEVLAGVLRGDVLVHCHSYRADEMLALLRVAEAFGVRIGTLQHALEAYKIAPEIVAHGAGVSTFSDWWAYKIEAYDAIPHNAAVLTRAGGRPSINSDSAEVMRHLNLEAAKSIRYGGLSETEALQLITLNPARQLGISDRVGSLSKGKDADFVLYDAHPFSVYSRPLLTVVDGEVVFSEADRSPPQTAPDFDPNRARRAPLPLPERAPRYALIGATIHPEPGVEIPDGRLVVDEGRIRAMGHEVAVPDDAIPIRVDGLHVYPGLIDAGTTLGLTEIGSVAGTRDVAEIGGIQPHIRAGAAVHAESAHLDVTRLTGITTVLTRPRGGIVAGQSAVLRLAGLTTEEVVIRDGLFCHVMTPPVPGPDASPEQMAKAKDRWQRLRDAFEEARRIDRLGREAEPRQAALLPVVRGERPVAFHARRAEQILAALSFAEEFELKAVLVGAREARKVVEAIREAGVPVIFGPVQSLPGGEFAPYDAVYRTPALLRRNGIRFCLQSANAANARILPYQAGQAAAWGLSKEDALRACTTWAAEILELKDRGALKPGNVADLIVTTGDPLEITTDVVLQMIDGQPVELKSRQTRLYEKYKKRLKKDF